MQKEFTNKLLNKLSPNIQLQHSNKEEARFQVWPQIDSCVYSSSINLILLATTCLWYNTLHYFLLEFSCETFTPLGQRFGFLKWITAYILKPPWSIQLLQGEILPRLIAQTRSLILCNVSEIARVALWRQHGMATPLFKLNMSIISAMSSAAGYVL